MYLAQTYSRIPKKLVRNNAHFLIIFKQDEKNLKHIDDDSCSTDMNFQNLKKWVVHAGTEIYSYHKTFENNRCNYRFGFHSLIIAIQ